MNVPMILQLTALAMLRRCLSSIYLRGCVCIPHSPQASAVPFHLPARLLYLFKVIHGFDCSTILNNQK
jgi:hypothetical protein